MGFCWQLQISQTEILRHFSAAVDDSGHQLKDGQNVKKNIIRNYSSQRISKRASCFFFNQSLQKFVFLKSYTFVRKSAVVNYVLTSSGLLKVEATHEHNFFKKSSLNEEPGKLVWSSTKGIVILSLGICLLDFGHKNKKSVSSGCGTAASGCTFQIKRLSVRGYAWRV